MYRNKMWNKKLVKKNRCERDTVYLKLLILTYLMSNWIKNVDVSKVEKDIGTYLVCSCCRANWNWRISSCAYENFVSLNIWIFSYCFRYLVSRQDWRLWIVEDLTAYLYLLFPLLALLFMVNFWNCPHAGKYYIQMWFVVIFIYYFRRGKKLIVYQCISFIQNLRKVSEFILSFTKTQKIPF